ncbi:MAG: HEAT repeat domain-containing protein [Planctomycetota bacterium]|nr:HEAT repeat domain-containing protein [Planctomycetota bacterium]
MTSGPADRAPSHRAPKRALWLAATLCFVACGPAPDPVVKPVLPPEAEAWVETMLTAEDSDARIEAHRKLGALGQVVVPRMIEILDADTGDDGNGAWAAEVLILLGPEAAPAAPALTQQLMETTVCNATTSAALIAIGKPALPHLIRALSSSIPASRVWAADALGELAEHTEDVPPALVALLDDPEPEVRSAVLFALRDFGSKAHPRATNRLLTMVATQDESVRAQVVEALAAATTDAGVKARLEALAEMDPSEDVRYAAREALAGD